MPACSNCGFPSDADNTTHDGRHREGTRREGPRRDVARVGSLAEAGYLIAVLEEVGVDADSRVIEDFNAATGEWLAAYRLSVPEEQVALAAQTLRTELDNEREADGFSAIRPAVGSPNDSVNPWWMLGVLGVVVAAGAVWAADRGDWPARRAAAGARPPAPTPLALLGRAVGPGGAEFYSDAQPGKPAQRLRFDGQGAWVLSVDADHDGRYERRMRFAAGGVEPAAAGR